MQIEIGFTGGDSMKIREDSVESFLERNEDAVQWLRTQDPAGRFVAINLANVAYIKDTAVRA